MIGKLQSPKYIPAYMRAKSACVNLARRPDLQVYPEGAVPFSTANLHGSFELIPALKLSLGRLKQKAIPAIKAIQEMVIPAAECGLALQIGEESDYLTLDRILRCRQALKCPPDFPVRVLDIQAFSPFLNFEFRLNNQSGNEGTSILGVGGIFDRCSLVFRGTNVYYDLFKKTKDAGFIEESKSFRANLDYFLLPNSSCEEILLFQLTVTVSSDNFKPIF